MQPLHKIVFDGDTDLVQVRRVARRIAQLVGFDQRDEVKITAAVSELTRAATSSGGGTVEVAFAVESDARATYLVIEVAGPGLEPEARRRGTGAANNVIAAEKLLDRLPSRDDGAALRFAKTLPGRAPALTLDRLATLRAELKAVGSARTDASREELVQQGRELAGALLDVEERKLELTTLNAELRDTNRGVMALYAELDERANHLRRADELKTRFFSQMSHEFRTPLSSILALSNMLLDESDGPLVEEQARQVRLIRDGVADLLDLVGDLLDLAKMEAGKTQVNVAEFSIDALFGALRGMIRPLLGSGAVTLEFGNAPGLPALVSDEAKVTQILRNFLSNAVKFTERGAITVGARRVPADEEVSDVRYDFESILFTVADTGIGIQREHQEAIFEEFQQVENRLQRKSRGTGLGLPLCRRLAGLLAGRVWVASEPGHGSTFFLQVPRVHPAATEYSAVPHERRPRLLIVDERAEQRAALWDTFRDSAFVPVEASAAEITPAALAALRPAAAVVAEPRAAPKAIEALRLAAVPVVAAPSADLSGMRDQLVADVYRTVLRAVLRCILTVDDDEAYRTILTKQFAPFCERVLATGDVAAGMAAAAAGSVDCVVLDLIMPEVDGITLLQQLRGDAATAQLPVVVCSSKVLLPEERARLRQLRAPFLAKDALAAAEIGRALVEARHMVASAPELAGRA
jgi:signal transduction histidine kinase/CheY-like chemotaxis protein